MLMSYSQLKTWDQCPAQWVVKYQLGWDTDPGLPALSGSWTHAFVAEKLGLAGQEFPDIPEVEQDLARRRGEAALVWLEGSGLEPVGVEEHRTVGEFHGYIDLLAVNADGELVVVDWKTGRGDPRQLAFYQVLVPGASDFRFVWLKHPDKVSEYRWDRSEESWPSDTMGRFRAWLETRVGETVPGWWCQWCPVSVLCPDGDKGGSGGYRRSS